MERELKNLNDSLQKLRLHKKSIKVLDRLNHLETRADHDQLRYSDWKNLRPAWANKERSCSQTSKGEWSKPKPTLWLDQPWTLVFTYWHVDRGEYFCEFRFHNGAIDWKCNTEISKNKETI